MNCSKCAKALVKGGDEEPIATISGGIMGDEYTDSWYFCRDCKVYTLETYRDCFAGEDTVTVRGPIEKAIGDEKVALIRKCPTPWSKRCRCPAHFAYFGGWLD